MNETIRDRIDAVNGRISAAAARSGRLHKTISLVAVTKTHPAAAVIEAIDAGHTIFGESRFPEAAQKYCQVRHSRPESRIQLRFVGHLQSNKARAAAESVDAVDSIDKLATARALASHLGDRRMEVLVQFNCSGESNKSGYSDAEQLIAEAAEIDSLEQLTVRGVMAIGPFTPDTKTIADAFSATRRIFERLRQALPHADTLSMGMSDDFEIAIAEGSTMLRLGTAIFGGRQR